MRKEAKPGDFPWPSFTHKTTLPNLLGNLTFGSRYGENRRFGVLLAGARANMLRFPRQGTATDPNAHPELKAGRVAAHFSDGSDVTSVPLNAQFPHGLFVAMSDNKTFHYYRWEDMLGKDVKVVQ